MAKQYREAEDWGNKMRTIELVSSGGMSQTQFDIKKDLTQRIIRKAQSVAINADAEMLFSLVFCTVPELRKIAKRLGA